MLKIRLKRMGKKTEPHYRVVVTQSTRARSSKTIAEVGYYNPRTQPSTFEIDKDEVQKWLKNGAQPSDTVAQYLVKQGLIEGLKRGSRLAQPKKKDEKKK